MSDGQEPVVPSLVLVEGGEVYDPEPRGVQSVLIAGDRVAKVGEVDRRAVERLGVDCDMVDARGCLVLPGLVDPHAHLLGGSGEGSLSDGSPMMLVEEIVRAGVTTVVGTLGVDTTMKNPPGLLARVKALEEVGLSAGMWTGGYNVPPTTLLGSVRQDMMFVDEVVGAGEVAISDERGLNQSAQELAKLVRDTHVGGLLSGKAGLTHFHVGEEKTRLAPLRELVEDFQVKCEWLYPTHVQRNERLLAEAIELAHNGARLDMDVVNEDLHRWLRHYIEEGGPLERLTVSSDMDSSTPDIFYAQFCGLVVKHGFGLDLVLPLFTSNTAAALGMKEKGRIAPGMHGDLLVVTAGTLDIVTVVARGRVVLREGTVLIRERWLKESKRSITILGDKHPSVRDSTS